MSQGDFDKGNPWAWSDKTITAQYEKLQEVYDMIEKYPNNMELGKVIRQWYWDNAKTLKK